MEQKLGWPLDYAEGMFSIINPDRLPHRFADSFYQACKSRWPRLSQLAGTVSIAAVAMARAARRIVMGEDVTPEFFVDIDESADADYRMNQARDRAKTHEFLKGLGLIG